METDLEHGEQAEDFNINGAENARDEIPTDPPVPEAFTVRDASSANWVVRRINEARAYRARIDAWAAREKRRADHEEEFFFRAFGYDLERWAAQEIGKLNGRKKTIFVPAGKLSFRHQNEKLVVIDEQQVIRWAKIDLPSAVQIKESLLKSILNDHFSNTGELPPATRLEPAYEKFAIG